MTLQLCNACAHILAKQFVPNADQDPRHAIRIFEQKKLRYM
jgi:hypothetical protein